MEPVISTTQRVGSVYQMVSWCVSVGPMMIIQLVFRGGTLDLPKLGDEEPPVGYL